MNSAYCTQRNGQLLEKESAVSHPVVFSGHRENLDYTTISSTSNTPRHYRRCFPGSTATQTSQKAKSGPYLTLITRRVARKRLTKPPELEQVEYVDSFDCGTATEWWIYILLNQTKPHKCGQSQQQYVVPHSKLFPSKAVSDR